MVGDAAGDGTDDGDLVGDGGGFCEVFAKNNSGDGCFGDAEGAAIFDGGVGLGVEGFLVGEAAGKDDLDDVFGGAVGTFGGAGEAHFAGVGAELEEVRETESHAAEEACLEETAAAEGGGEEGAGTGRVGR